MKNKLGMTRIASMMSQATGRPKNLCEDFLRELFSICADALEEGDSVRIKGFGTFKLAMVEARKSVDVSTGEDIVIEPYRKVLFVASRELAAAVNSPFEMFQTVELAENDTAVEDSEENPEEEAEKIITEAENQIEAEADNLAKAEKEAEIVSVLRSEEVTPAPDNSDSPDNSESPRLQIRLGILRRIHQRLSGRRGRLHDISESKLRHSKSRESGYPGRRKGDGRCRLPGHAPEDSQSGNLRQPWKRLGHDFRRRFRRCYRCRGGGYDGNC